ncbi:MAG TPA: Rieske 2Fe-2S domain-containing protein [Tepidisphaeraceae bacterium]|nr:Rieske 2Fe-2S domain-containing protein [Tepidisphaeraceae bacterium]
MAETHQIVTKVWIAPGCIVCDSCENDCPEVFEVLEDTCVIRPPAQGVDFLRPLTPSIIVAAEGCPVEVIKFEVKEVEGAAPWVGQPAEGVGAAAASPAAAGGEVSARAPAAKVAAPPAPPDPKWQALISTSKVSPSKSAGLATTVRKSAEVVQAEEMIHAVNLPKDAPPDQKMAMLSVGGAYAPQPSLADRIRSAAAGAGKSTRRSFNIALAVAWFTMAAVGATFAAMFQDFFGPKVLKEPKKMWRVGRLEQYSIPGSVDETFKRTPAGSEGFWIVNLQPSEERLVALNTICTHLGCIPNWLTGDQKFKCPCHGSGYYITGVNFEGPTPRPLERFAITKDADGYVWVDQTKVYRQELGQWDDPESFVALS